MNSLPFAAAQWQEFACPVRIDPHAYRQHQLIYAVKGTLAVEIDAEVWLLTPRRGLWIPARTAHSLDVRSDVSLCRILVDPLARAPAFPHAARAAVLSSLLRELLLRTVVLPPGCSADHRAVLILALILEETTWAADTPLPMPRDARLRRVCDAIVADPADRRSLEQWAAHGALSTRTLARLFHAELGISYRYWRQLAVAASALPRLEAGEPVTKVAFDLGYESAGAFSAMFRRIMRTCPSQYRGADNAAASRPALACAP